MRGGILERLADGIVLGDGGYLLELEKRGYVQAGPFTPEVSVTHPEALAQLHREFMLAGADGLQTMWIVAQRKKDRILSTSQSGNCGAFNLPAAILQLPISISPQEDVTCLHVDGFGPCCL